MTDDDHNTAKIVKTLTVKYQDEVFNRLSEIFDEISSDIESSDIEERYYTTALVSAAMRILIAEMVRLALSASESKETFSEVINMMQEALGPGTEGLWEHLQKKK